MKLLYCPDCYDIKRLSLERVHCYCGNSWARVKGDYFHSVFGGKAVPLGIANVSFGSAIRNRPQSGLGSEFKAFVIPSQCETVEYE